MSHSSPVMIDVTTLLPLIEAARKTNAAIAESDATFQSLPPVDQQKRMTAYTNRQQVLDFDFNNAASLAMDELLKLVPPTGAPVVITDNVKTIQPPALKAGLGHLPFHDFSSAEVKPFDLSGFKITDLIHIGPPVPSTPPADGSSWLNGVETKASIPELVAQYLQGMVGVMLDFDQKQTLIAVLTKLKADVTLSDLSDALTQYEVLTPFRDALQKCQNSGGFGHLFTQNADV
ncbi:hypothetical protein K5D56_26530 [Pseudomonas cichorii]|nr:hypothetical protein [Pseudomonas cichorii]MBX8557168.1 hypothetical protein [Pseudomonas cichorii]MBX8592934.1 hypothetical protein [Pseudomonas cichorii]